MYMAPGSLEVTSQGTRYPEGCVVSLRGTRFPGHGFIGHHVPSEILDVFRKYQTSWGN